MWVATQDLPRSGAQPFYARLNQILDQQDFDEYIEGLCERFYADDGRPGLPPRALLGHTPAIYEMASTISIEVSPGNLPSMTHAR